MSFILHKWKQTYNQSKKNGIQRQNIFVTAVVFSSLVKISDEKGNNARFVAKEMSPVVSSDEKSPIASFGDEKSL